MANAITLYIPFDALRLPDNDQWQFRFEVRSSSSDRVYVISQNKRRLHWGCSCPGYRIYRKCKHLESLGIPCKEVPYEAVLRG